MGCLESLEIPKPINISIYCIPLEFKIPKIDEFLNPIFDILNQ